MYSCSFSNRISIVPSMGVYLTAFVMIFSNAMRNKSVSFVVMMGGLLGCSITVRCLLSIEGFHLLRDLSLRHNVRNISMNNHFNFQPPCANGFSTLTAVILLGAVASVITVTYLSLNISSLNLARVEEQGLRARSYAESCLERGVWELWRDSTYSGGDIMTFTEGSCEILAPIGSGVTNRTVQALGTSGNATIRMQTLMSSIDEEVFPATWGTVDTF